MCVCVFIHPSQIPLNRWSIFYPKRCAEQVEELVVTFGKVAGPMGLRLDRPVHVEVKDDRTETYIKSIHSQLNSEVKVGGLWGLFKQSVALLACFRLA